MLYPLSYGGLPPGAKRFGGSVRITHRDEGAPVACALVRRCRSGIARAKDVLGGQPRVSLDGGLRKTIAWFDRLLRTERRTGVWQHRGRSTRPPPSVRQGHARIERASGASGSDVLFLGSGASLPDSTRRWGRRR